MTYTEIIENLVDNTLDNLVEKVVKNKIEVHIDIEPDRAEITISPWKSYEMKCPYNVANPSKE